MIDELSGQGSTPAKWRVANDNGRRNEGGNDCQKVAYKVRVELRVNIDGLNLTLGNIAR